MDRLACANLPAFPLQLLARRHPEWAAYPVAVVAEDKPQGKILCVNDKARRAGVLPGFRYAAGFSLTPGLRAAVVLPAEIEKEVAALTKRFLRFTPEVEPSSEEPGVFWLSGTGLDLLYASLEAWAHAVCRDIKTQGYSVNVAVGFTRFGTYAVAKTRPGTVVFGDPSRERAAAGAVSLDRLNLDPDFRDTLSKLGIKTVGTLLSLPAGGLCERFGLDAQRLYKMAAGELWAPLQPRAPEEPVRQSFLLDDTETDVTRILFLVRRLLHPMLSTLAKRCDAIAELRLRLLVDGKGWREERIRPAVATLDSVQLLDLVRLRLETVQFTAGVTEIELTAGVIPATQEQLRFFAEPGRDLDAANRALARLRAEFGDRAVVRAKLADGHLPEARFSWEPLERVKLPENPLKGERNVLIRRIFTKPIPLSAPPRMRDDGWLLLGPKYGAVEKLSGPYVFSGGWWNREIQRDYYFAETRRGDLLWVYYDRVRRKWFLQGWVA